MSVLLHHLLDETATRTPDVEALRFEGKAIPYEALARWSNQVAHTLTRMGVTRGDRVGIYLPKGFEAVVALYGTLKAGAAFVPLDPWQPPDRLARVIADCGIDVLFSGPSRATGLSAIRSETGRPLRVLGVATSPDDGDAPPSLDWAAVLDAPDEPPDVDGHPDDLAYVFYTSGSTGEPKGMMHTHRSGWAFVDWATRTFSVQPDDRIGNHAPLHFDLSLFDYLATASVGGTTVIVSEAHQKVPASLARLLEDEQLTVWYSVPLAWTQMTTRGGLDERDLSRLRLVLFGGEPCPLPVLREAMAHASNATFYHVYGVTETNVCTYYRVPRPLPPDETVLPIGRLGDTFDAVVLEGDRLAPPGVVGELAITGPGVMRGYWGRPDTDAQAFWTASPSSGHRYYRTGDLVQLDPDGLYYFMGRADRQIKSRGHRIELDEVQDALAALAVVDEAAVFATPDEDGSQRLVAVLSLCAGCEWHEHEARKALRTRTAAYAVPSSFHVVPALPRTSAGKVDYGALRRLPAKAVTGSE